MWSARRPLSRLRFLVHDLCDFSCGFAKNVGQQSIKRSCLHIGDLNCSQLSIVDLNGMVGSVFGGISYNVSTIFAKSHESKSCERSSSTPNQNSFGDSFPRAMRGRNAILFIFSHHFDFTPWPH